MLVLSRQRDQSVMIGDDVEVKVVDVRGDKVRLGINAPRDVTVHRKEVFEAIRDENRLAASVQPGDLGDIAVAPARMIASAPHNTDTFLRAAIEEAKLGLAEGGLPIGSVLVRNNQIIGRGHNQRIQKSDPMAHAEIDCLKNAGRQSIYRDTILYSTLMPCYLCAGAAVQFGIPRIVVGESVNFSGAADFMRQHGIAITDLRDAECIEIMSRFIREHPDLWHEDIGK